MPERFNINVTWKRPERTVVVDVEVEPPEHENLRISRVEAPEVEEWDVRRIAIAGADLLSEESLKARLKEVTRGSRGSVAALMFEGDVPTLLGHLNISVIPEDGIDVVVE